MRHPATDYVDRLKQRLSDESSGRVVGPPVLRLDFAFAGLFHGLETLLATLRHGGPISEGPC